MSTLLAILEFSGITDMITGLLGTIIYPLFSIIFGLIWAVQQLFFKFAGTDDMSFGGTNIYSKNNGLETETGLIYYLLTYPLVKNMLLSIMVLALFLIIVFTAMAFIKNMYAAKPKGWKEIVGNAIKGLANFIFIPVCCVLGVWLGNILLNAINAATSKGGAVSMDRKLFIASAYNANLYRTDNVTGPEVARQAYNKGYGSGGETAVPDGLTDEEYANIVDSVFTQTDIPYLMYWDVWEFYSLWQINYLVLVVGGVFMLYVLGSLTFAMIRRMFYIVVLFIISPGVCAMYPLDDGGAVGSWKGEFIKQVVSAYGAVAGVNIFFSIVPLIEEIQLFNGDVWKGFGINDIAHIFILVSGLIVVKELTGLLSGFFKGEDALSKGSGLMSSTRSAMKKYGGGAVTKTVGAFAAAKGKADAGKGNVFTNLLKSTGTSLGSSLTSAVTGGIFDPKGIKKAYTDAHKEGKEKAWDNYKPKDDPSVEKARSALNVLKKANKGTGEKFSTLDIINILKDIKDDKEKEKLESQMLAWNNRIASSKGEKIDKAGSYIEKAKAAKDYEKQQEANEKNILKVQAKRDKADELVDAVRTAGDTSVSALQEWINSGEIEVEGVKFKNADVISASELKAKLDSREKIDTSQYTDVHQKQVAAAFNKQLEAIIKSEKELEKAIERRNAMEESLNDAIDTAKDAMLDFAKSIKFEGFDTSKIDKEVSELKDSVDKIGTTAGKLDEEMQNFKESFKNLTDINKLASKK